MNRRTTLTAATCGIAAAAVLLTACGGSKNDDAKISTAPTTASAPTTTAAPTTSAPVTTPPAEPKAPVFDFPSDVKVIVDADKTGDATKDAVLRDQAYGQQAIFLAIAKLDPNLPVLNKYLSGEALGDWINKINSAKSQHTTVTGTTLFYNRSVHVTGPSTAGVTFCESQRNAFNKDTKSGKVTRTKPSKADFIEHYSLMSKAADGTWRVSTYQSQEGASQCQR
ncbi:hypothetical protein [Streptomyces sp. CA-111067]|uniref:hypothetical protein n=1 Tax=Streptomyces sp. CA-111067 TaxID=3240046 RepID=UPI003D9739F9